MTDPIIRRRSRRQPLEDPEENKTRDRRPTIRRIQYDRPELTNKIETEIGDPKDVAYIHTLQTINTVKTDNTLQYATAHLLANGAGLVSQAAGHNLGL